MSNQFLLLGLCLTGIWLLFRQNRAKIMTKLSHKQNVSDNKAKISSEFESKS